MKKKYIWSYWTKPQKNPRKEIINIALLALSIERAKNFASDITIYTDDLGKEILSAFGIKERFDTLLNDIPSNIPGSMFAYAKMLALSRQTDPVIHIDHDVILNKDFSEHSTESDIVTEILENVETQKIHFHRLISYIETYDDLMKQGGKDVLDFIYLVDQKDNTELLQIIPGYNCGFINSINVDVTQKWTSESLKKFEKLIDLKLSVNGYCNVLLEQSLLYYMSKKHEWKIGTLFSEEDTAPPSNYFHAMGLKRETLGELHSLVLEKLEEANPITNAKIWKTFKIYKRKNIRNNKIFAIKDNDIVFENEKSKEDFFISLNLFLIAIFKEENSLDLELKKLRSSICKYFSHINLCQLDEPLSLQDLAKIFDEDHNETFISVIAAIKDSKINLNTLNRFAKNARVAMLFDIRSRKSRSSVSLEFQNPGAQSPESTGPSLLKMAGNFATAMKDFAKSGFLKITKEQYDARMDICNGCEFWKANARMGMGKCLKCGCTGAKQWIATSVCPINKWGAISKEEVEASLKEKENAEAQETQSPVSQQADGSSQEPSPEVQG